MTGVVDVFVVEPGTFKLSGVVFDSGGGSLDGVTVEVVAGTGQGLRTTTRSQGQYALYGVAGWVQLRASADGFTPQILEVVVTSNNATGSFTLTPVEAPADVSGLWTMTVAPAPGCRAGLPQIAQGRAYQVQLIQQGTRLHVRITGPTLQVSNAHQLSGSVLGLRVQVSLPGDTSYGEWSSSNLYDHLSPTEKLGFSGIIEGSLIGAEIRATMYGDLVYWNAQTFEPGWYCRADNHAVTLRRG
jgi:hypothetical protein